MKKFVKFWVMMDRNNIYKTDVLSGLEQIEDSSVDIIIADPPYNIGKEFGDFKCRLETTKYVSWCLLWISECIRILKDTGTMFVYGFSENLAHISANIPLSKRWLIWHYTNKTIPRLNFWQRSHESIIMAWKEKPIFNKDDVREQYTDTFLKNAVGKTRKNTKGRFSRGNKETTYVAHEKGALPRDVIKIPALAGGAGRRERWFYCKDCLNTFLPAEIKNHAKCEIIKHPTQKPVALTEKLMLSCKPENDGLVVIPFAGSGSEALVARVLGMDFIGFEICQDYVEMANSLVDKWDIIFAQIKEGM